MATLLARGALIGGDGRHDPTRDLADSLSKPGWHLEYRLTDSWVGSARRAGPRRRREACGRFEACPSTTADDTVVRPSFHSFSTGRPCARLRIVSNDLPLPGRNQRLSPAERERAAAILAGRYQQGHSIRRLSTDTGYSLGRVRGLLLAAGVTFRGRGGDNRRRPDLTQDGGRADGAAPARAVGAGLWAGEGRRATARSRYRRRPPRRWPGNPPARRVAAALS